MPDPQLDTRHQSDQIRRVRGELAATRKQLAAAHGQILRLGRQRACVEQEDQVAEETAGTS